MEEVTVGDRHLYLMLSWAVLPQGEGNMMVDPTN